MASRGIVGLLVLALGACSSPATQLVLVVDTNLRVPAELDLVSFEITTPGGSLVRELAPVSSPGAFPLTLTLVPRGELGPFLVRVGGERGGSELVAQLRRVSMTEGTSLMLRFHLTADCVEHECEATSETCAAGRCEGIDAIPEPWPGAPPRDAGQATMDGGVDAATDAPVVSVDAPPATDDALDTATCSAADCDDDDECTDDLCSDGGCTHVLSTECTGCVLDTDCPSPTSTEWSECAYADACTSAGERTRDTRSYGCQDSTCIVSTLAETDTEGCVRDTEGTECALEAGAWSECRAPFPATCAAMGMRSREVQRSLCRAEACVPMAPAMESEECSRGPTEGDACLCGGASCACSAEMCVPGMASTLRVTVRATLDATGTLTATCRDGTGDSCTATGLQSCEVRCELGSTIDVVCASDMPIRVTNFVVQPMCTPSMMGTRHVSTCTLTASLFSGATCANL